MMNGRGHVIVLSSWQLSANLFGHDRRGRGRIFIQLAQGWREVMKNDENY